MENISEKFAMIFKGEPEKTFIKAGILTTNESLTADGRALFEAWLLKKFGAEFKTEVVDKIIAEDKE